MTGLLTALAIMLPIWFMAAYASEALAVRLRDLDARLIELRRRVLLAQASMTQFTRALGGKND